MGQVIGSGASSSPADKVAARFLAVLNTDEAVKVMGPTSRDRMIGLFQPAIASRYAHVITVSKEALPVYGVPLVLATTCQGLSFDSKGMLIEAGLSSDKSVEPWLAEAFTIGDDLVFLLAWGLAHRCIEYNQISGIVGLSLDRAMELALWVDSFGFGLKLKPGNDIWQTFLETLRQDVSLTDEKHLTVGAISPIYDELIRNVDCCWRGYFDGLIQRLTATEAGKDRELVQRATDQISDALRPSSADERLSAGASQSLATSCGAKSVAVSVAKETKSPASYVLEEHIRELMAGLRGTTFTELQSSAMNPGIQLHAALEIFRLRHPSPESCNPNMLGEFRLLARTYRDYQIIFRRAVDPSNFGFLAQNAENIRRDNIITFEYVQRMHRARANGKVTCQTCSKSVSSKA